MNSARFLAIGSFLGMTFLVAGCGQPKPDYSTFAQCLTDRGIVMYGAFWCPHCSTQKELFGDAFEYINYVECDRRGYEAKPELYIEKDIQSYPTWIHPDGRRWEGSQPLEDLSAVSGCELPGSESTETATELSSLLLHG